MISEQRYNYTITVKFMSVIQKKKTVHYADEIVYYT